MTTFDENGYDAYYQYWMDSCRTGDTASNGQRVTSAVALQIASDVLRRVLDYQSDGMVLDTWTADDIKLALGAIAGIRAQRGCEEMDPAVTDGYLTHYMDIVIYG